MILSMLAHSTFSAARRLSRRDAPSNAFIRASSKRASNSTAHYSKVRLRACRASRPVNSPTFFLATTAASSSSFSSLCTGICDRESIVLNNSTHSVINEGDLLIALRCSSGTVNSQGYVQLKDLFQKKNIHLNDTVPFRTVDGDEESFFSLLLQKSSILAATLVKTIADLMKSRTIKIVRYLKGKRRLILILRAPRAALFRCGSCTDD